MRTACLAVFLAAAAALPARAEVFKCVDGQGRTTYQQSPCGKDAKGSRVELTPDNGVASDAPDLEAKWAAAAKAGQVQPGMPKRFVQSAWGAPTEVRAGTPAERVSEIWVYRNSSGARRVGFLDGRVSWERGEDASAEPPMADEAADTAARRGDPMAAIRQSITPGQDCSAALATAGAPDRSEPVQFPAYGPGGKQVMAQGMRHVYGGGLPSATWAIVCLNEYVHQVQPPPR